MRHMYCTGIDKRFNASVDQVSGEAELALLTEIAQTGTEGYYPWGRSKKAIVKSLMNRDSESTLLRKVHADNVRIHHYSHALYLHGVTGPKYGKAKEEIEAVKEKFGMNAKAKSA